MSIRAFWTAVGAAAWVEWFERFGLSGYFLYCAWRSAPFVYDALAGAAPIVALARHVLMVSMQLLVALLLLLGRRMVDPPRRWRDVIVPLVANFSYIPYGWVGALSPWLSLSRWPEAWRKQMTYTALLLSLCSVGMAVWAIAYLGRSFAVTVAVKKVVVRGPYRLVRHPIYLSYLLQSLALVLAVGSIAVMTLALGQGCLIVYRARLEEALLGAASVEYRSYRRGTSFLIPGLH